MEKSSEEIVLEIEDTPLTCKKDALIANSDYFKAMLQGNFIEREKRIIKLEDVNLKAMTIILTLLWDETFLVESEYVLPVLQVACMLQFVKIKKMCLDIVLETLSPANCLQVWHATERLDIKPLYMKAKAMALEEFLQIKDDDYILELTLNDIYYYLGHIHLKTDNELTVFRTAIKWWYHNSKQYFENSTKHLLKLLSCITYQRLLDHHLREITVYPDIANNVEVNQILSCIILIKNGQTLDFFPEFCQETAKLLWKSKSRISPLIPSILIKFKESADITKPNVLEKGDQKVIYYDVKSKEFKNCFNIDCNKCQNLTGFKLMGYKEFVFMYGGEFLIGRGNWNTNFWVYDTIREKWERKGVMPFVRRHFETCMVGNNLYIMGGTGMYRLLQENMVWYSFKDDKWSGQIKLPCTSRQLKCCSFLNSFFILNINNKCGYFFNDNSSNWNKLVIKGDVTNCNSEFSIFANRSKLYVKGKNLTEFIVQDNELVLVSVKHITDMCYEKMETALCNDTIYTLYMRRFEDNDMYSLETYNLETGITDFIFQDVFNESIVSTDSQGCISSMSIFPLQYYILVEKNAMINDCFE